MISNINKINTKATHQKSFDLFGSVAGGGGLLVVIPV
jgi:hypothetical protein